MLSFIDLFAGIGGNRLAFEQVGGKCVFCCEIDEKNKETYEVNFGERPHGDIRDINAKSIPDHDILIASLPVQGFTLAVNTKLKSVRNELHDTLFYKIVRILKEKKPRSFLIETLTGLLSSSLEETFNNMIWVLNGLGYQISHQLINAKALVPQNRQRVYIVGFKEMVNFEFPYIPQQGPALKTILEDYVDEKYTLSDKLWQDIQHRGKQQIYGQYYRLADINSYSGPLLSNYLRNPNKLLIADKGKKPRRLTPRESARLQGFPDQFVIPVSDEDAYRQFGNSSTVPVVSMIAKNIIQALNINEVTRFTNTGINTSLETNVKKTNMNFETEEQLINYTRGIIGKSFKEIDMKRILQGNNNDKGRLGKVVETGFYGYELNNRSEADFDKLGIELKVSGFNELQDGSWSAKERISLSMINYKNIIHEEFEFSKLISKNRKLLIIWYEYIKGIPYEDFVIRDFQLYDMSKDEAIIRNDFYIIKQKVEAGLAHKLSEGDSVILGAATKGQKGQTAEQPNSPIFAPTRAFSLKNSYFRGVLIEHVKSKDKKSIEFVTPEGFVWNRLKPYKGLSQLDILNYYMNHGNNRGIPKNISKMISDRVVGNDNKLSEEHEVFSKSRFLIKNIPILKDNWPIENATFSTLQISDFAYPWEESDWKTFFEEVTFIYIGYLGERDGQLLGNGYRLLDRIFKVTFTHEEVQEFGKTYNKIKEAIETNDLSKLPTASKETQDELKLVISTKSNSKGAYSRFLHDDKRETCFMLNKDFIYKKFNESITLS
ncbi:Sau3AI family type II restriction endonuclease [Peribacillus frigoritolerans]|uniref:Sau3AI family type II restriction endonuclease n=1 Tax=Peribacillus frigoritolerans TaxID=450367 RepID=UPI003CFBC913